MFPSNTITFRSNALKKFDKINNKNQKHSKLKEEKTNQPNSEKTFDFILSLLVITCARIEEFYMGLLPWRSITKFRSIKAVYMTAWKERILHRELHIHECGISRNDIRKPQLISTRQTITQKSKQRWKTTVCYMWKGDTSRSIGDNALENRELLSHCKCHAQNRNAV